MFTSLTKMWCKHCKVRAVVVAQLVERSLPIPKVRGSNPVIGKNLFILNICLLSTVYWKDENKKEARNGPFFKKTLQSKDLTNAEKAFTKYLSCKKIDLQTQTLVQQTNGQTDKKKWNKKGFRHTQESMDRPKGCGADGSSVILDTYSSNPFIGNLWNIIFC